MSSIIKSRFLGEVEVDEANLIDFGGSIMGFEDYSKFYLLNNDNDENSIFKILQSADKEDLCWIVIDPFIPFPDYELEVHDEDVASLAIANKEDILTFVVVTIVDGDYKNMTANLVGPIIINIKNKMGKQCIAKGAKYTTKHKLIQTENSTAV